MNAVLTPSLIRPTKRFDSDNLLWVQFRGAQLDSASIPVYELGRTLIAVQRIVHKAHESRIGGAVKGRRMHPEVRRRLALRLRAWETGSDAYGITSFLTEPAVIDHLKTLIVDGLVALGAYALGRVSGRRRESENQEQPLVGPIYNEVKIITDRIENVGEIESIDISSSKDDLGEGATFNVESQRFVRGLRDEKWLGENQEIRGTVERLDPQQETVEIRDQVGRRIRILPHPGGFELVRYSVVDYLIVAGRPVYRFGDNPGSFREFEAHEIRILDGNE